jgi:ABC-2 type transport system permease protein
MNRRTPSRIDGSTLIGTAALTKLALRRDRWMISLWVLGIALIAIATVSSYRDLYPTLSSRLNYAHGVEGSSGLLALTGKPFDLTTIGGLVAWRTTSFEAVLAGVMSLLLVVRHTRAEEESGRLELLGSARVGRYAALTAALLTALAADAALAVLVALGAIGLGLPVIGSIALGLAYTATGVVFAAIAAVSAQLTERSRAANGISFGLLGAAYLLRAIGDSAGSGGPAWLSWLSPIGWSEQLRPFAGEHWWLLAVFAGAAAVLLGVGYRLAGRRDLGAGLLPSRPGPAHAVRWLRTASALAWRLQRATLLAWAVGFAAIGAVLGGVANSVSSLADSDPQIRDLLNASDNPQDLVDGYFAVILTVAGIVAAAYAVQAVSRLSGEENAQRAEPLLSTATSRVRWALGHLVIGLVGAAFMLVILGLAAGLVYGVDAGDVGGQLPRVVGAALVQVFAVWIFAGLVIALFGLAPRWTPAAWGAVLLALALNLLGTLLDLNHWLLDLSPFNQLPALPRADLTWTPLIGLAAVTVALITTGLTALNHRDLR